MPKALKAPVGKAKKIIHPNSRAASKLQRQSCRAQRMLNHKAESSQKLEQLRQKLQWYQDHLDPNNLSYTKHELAKLTCEYLERFKDETEQIAIVNSVGNRQATQHVSRETAIRITEERERQEFECMGIEIPDIVNGKNLENFRTWTGEIKFFANIKMRKSKRSDLNAENEVDGDTEKSSDELPDFVD